MQGFDEVENELWRLGGDELLADAHDEAQTYADLYFPWDGDGDEPEPRRAARRRVLASRADAARAEQAARCQPAHPEGGAMLVQGPVADLAARIAVAVQACPLIAGLHSGYLDAIATDTEGGRLVGVRLDGDAVVVGVVARDQASRDLIVDQVRAAVEACTPAASVSVSVAARHDPDTDALTGDGAP